VEGKKKLILAKLQGTIELVKYYGTTWNCPKSKWTLAQGKFINFNFFTKTPIAVQLLILYFI